MVSIDVRFPESVFKVLRMAPHELVREVRIAATIHWYEQHLISTDQAAEFTGMSQAEFVEELARRHVNVEN